MMRVVVIWVCLLGMCLVTGCGGGQAASTGETAAGVTERSPSITPPAGFFAMAGLNTTNVEKARLLALPHVAGMTAFIGWDELEPQAGQLDFSRLDADIELARAAGKKVSLGVFTGRNSLPAWLAAHGVRTWTTTQGTTLVHPADETFVTLWSARVRQLGQRYADNPTVVQVTICGAAGTLCGPRYPELPADLTYEQALRHWQQVVEAYVQAFPRTYKNLEVHLSANGWGTRLPLDLFAGIGQGVAIGPFAEFLSDTEPSAGSTTGAAFKTIVATRPWCALQMVSPLGEKVTAAVLRGRSYGCSYFEIYPTDLTDQAAALAGL